MMYKTPPHISRRRLIEYLAINSFFKRTTGPQLKMVGNTETTAATGCVVGHGSANLKFIFPKAAGTVAGGRELVKNCEKGHGA